VNASVFLDALAATATDLIVGLVVCVPAALFIGVVLYLQVRDAQEVPDLEPAIEEEDIWAGLRPDRDARVAETDFGSDRWAA
jgi:hypothetical protein